MKETILIQRAPRDGQHPYMQLYRKVPQDLSLTAEERGVLIYILSLPQYMITDMEEIGRRNGIGVNKMRRMIAKFKKVGYCEVTHTKDGQGRFSTSNYLFHEQKIQVSQVVDNELPTPHPENPSVADDEYEPLHGNRATDPVQRKPLNGSLEKDEENPAPHISTLDKDYKSKDTPPTPASGEAADAACVSSSFSSDIKEATDKFIAAIKAVKPTYIPPKQRKSWHQSMQKLLHEEQRSIERILSVLTWALNDNTIRGDWNGWSSKLLLSKNPVEYLRSKFEGIETQSQARAERKFAPSSDDQKAYEALTRFKDRAL